MIQQSQCLWQVFGGNSRNSSGSSSNAEPRNLHNLLISSGSQQKNSSSGYFSTGFSPKNRDGGYSKKNAKAMLDQLAYNNKMLLAKRYFDGKAFTYGLFY